MQFYMKISKELSLRLRAVVFLCALFAAPLHGWLLRTWFDGTSLMLRDQMILMDCNVSTSYRGNGCLPPGR